MISNVSPSVPGSSTSQAAERPEARDTERFSAELVARAAPQTVRAVRTPLSGEQAAQALDRAWQQVMGEKPSEETKAILTAQWAHETGRGSAMMNFNFGGLKGSSPTGFGTTYTTHEGWGKSEVKIVDRFRAYQTADEGAADYVALLNRRYPGAIEAAKSGDPAKFVRELKQARYFTGNEGAYVKSVSSLAQAALASGFTSLGGANAETSSFPTFLAQSPLNGGVAYADAFNGTLPGGPLDTLSFTGVEAIADEVGRAALRDATERKADENRRG